MAKKVNDTAKRQAVAKVFADAMEMARTMGTQLVTQVCNVSRKFYGAQPIPAEDISDIIDRLAQLRGWKEDSTGKVRRSEAKKLLEAHHMLGELSELYREKSGHCTWHDVVRLAREVSKHSGKTRVRQAVMAMVTKSKPIAPNKLSRGDAKARVASSVKGILKMTKLEPAFRNALEELCAEYNINV